MGSISHSHLSDTKWFLTVKTYTQKSVRMIHSGEVSHRCEKRASASLSFFILMLFPFFFFCSVCSECLALPHVYSKRFIDFLTSCYFSSPRLFFSLSYKKWVVTVVMQDAYLHCSPQSSISAEIMRLKRSPIINSAVIFKWLLTIGSWNQKLYK